MTLSVSDKVVENRLRREAKRRGLALIKSPRRDSRAFDYGLYVLVPLSVAEEARGGGEVVEKLLLAGKGMTMQAVEEKLNQPTTPTVEDAVRDLHGSLESGPEFAVEFEGADGALAYIPVDPQMGRGVIRDTGRGRLVSRTVTVTYSPWVEVPS